MRYKPKNRAGQKMWSADAVDQPDGLLAAARQLKRSNGAGPNGCVPLACASGTATLRRQHRARSHQLINYARSESGSTVAIEVDEVRCRAESITGAQRCFDASFDAPLAVRDGARRVPRPKADQVGSDWEKPCGKNTGSQVRPTGSAQGQA